MPEISRDLLLLTTKAASDTYLRIMLVGVLGEQPLLDYVRSLGDGDLLALLTSLDGNAWSMVLGNAHPRTGEPA